MVYEGDNWQIKYTRFITEIAHPALKDICKELGQEPELSLLVSSNYVGITVKKKDKTGNLIDIFKYAIQIQHDVPGAFPIAVISFLKDGKWISKNEHIKNQDKEVENTTKDDIVINFWKNYVDICRATYKELDSKDKELSKRYIAQGLKIEGQPIPTPESLNVEAQEEWDRITKERVIAEADLEKAEKQYEKVCRLCK